MNKISLLSFFISVIIITQTYADTLFINRKLGYKSYLPDNWICEEKDSSQHYFYDTTGTFGALLSIVRYPMDTIYDTPEEWTLAHFIAYTMYMDYYPFGTVLFSDSSITEQQGDLRATEIYLRFYTDDTLDYAWDEYIRYTATQNYGWELYAIGDTTDMMTNIGTYGAILKIIEISEDFTPIISPYTQKYHNYLIIDNLPVDASNCLFNILGRRLPSTSLQNRSLSQGMYIFQKKKIITLPTLK